METEEVEHHFADHMLQLVSSASCRDNYSVNQLYEWYPRRGGGGANLQRGLKSLHHRSEIRNSPDRNQYW